MEKNLPFTDDDGEVRELTTEDFAKAIPFSALPESLRQKLTSRGAQKAPTKARITLRLSQDVVSRFRATGSGWQTRMDTALQDWLKTHSPA